jgi:hypothetical protein
MAHDDSDKPLNPEPYRHPDHPRPVTRRQFLAQGFLTGAAIVASPSLFGALRGGGYAAAQECGISAGAGLIPFMCFDLGGGASVAGSNVLTGGPGGQEDLLSDEGYLQLGLPASLSPRQPGQIDRQLGLAFHQDSAFLRGILGRTTLETRQNMNGFVICARSENDTGNNPHNPLYGINKAGADGELVTLIGTDSSVSGGNSAAPMSMIDPAVRPVKVSRPSDATGLVDTGRLVSLLNQQDAGSVMRAVEAVSELKLDKITEEDALEQLIRCNYVTSSYLVENFGNPALLDPNADPNITGAAGVFPEGLVRSEYEKTASVMKLVVNGFAGAGCCEFGGYDYHDGTRATGERKDELAGECIGAAFEYARLQNKELVVYVFSDGSVFSDGVLEGGNGRGKGVWRGDRSSTASVFMLAYSPAGAASIVPGQQQIGYFRPSGDLETSATRVSNNVNLLVEAVVLNYLALHDDLGRFTTVLPDQGLGDAGERDALVAFNPLPRVPIV